MGPLPIAVFSAITLERSEDQLPDCMGTAAHYHLSMVCSKSDRLSGAVEVNETLVGGIGQGGKRGRRTNKSIVVVAVEVKETTR